MKKYIIAALPLALAILLAVAACEDEKKSRLPSVTLSSGGVSTDFDTFLHATTKISGIDALVILSTTASDTLFMSFTAVQLVTDSPISLENALRVIVLGTLGRGQIVAINGQGSTGSLTFTRLNSIGVVSGEFSDNATLLGYDSDSGAVVVNISGSFSALGGYVPIMSALPKRIETLMRSVAGR